MTKKQEKSKIETNQLLKIQKISNIFFIILTFITIIVVQTKEIVFLCMIAWILVIVNYIITNRILADVKAYSNHLGKTMDKIMLGYDIQESVLFEESLLSKNQIQLNRVCNVIKNTINESEQEKIILQELITDISHQVKTPLANINLYIEILKKKDLSLEDKHKYLEVLSEQINRLDFLMESLIKISRLETGIFILKPQKQSIYNTLANVLSQIMVQVEKKQIEIIVECPEDLNVLHDAKWTEEALYNVLDNAVKYTQQSGYIGITVNKYEIYSVIEIEDNGRGIANDELLKIFHRFYRGKNAVNESGTGIGLYLTRKIITMEKGYITVESVEHKGTKFKMFLYN